MGQEDELTGTPVEPLLDNYYYHFRKNYRGRITAHEEFTPDAANALLESGLADLVSYGASSFAKPDLVARFEHALSLPAANPQSQA